MAKGPGYALAQFLAEHGASGTVHETKYEHGMFPSSTRPPVLVERLTITLPDGTQLGMDVRFEEDT